MRDSEFGIRGQVVVFRRVARSDDRRSTSCASSLPAGPLQPNPESQIPNPEARNPKPKPETRKPEAYTLRQVRVVAALGSGHVDRLPLAPRRYPNQLTKPDTVCTRTRTGFVPDDTRISQLWWGLEQSCRVQRLPLASRRYPNQLTKPNGVCTRSRTRLSRVYTRRLED